MRLPQLLNLIAFLALVGLFTAISYYAFGFSVAGSSEMMGFVMGSGLVALLITVPIKKTCLAEHQTTIALLLVILALGISRYDDLRFGIDVSEAKTLLSGGVDEDKIEAALLKSPNNTILRLTREVMLAQNESNSRIQALFDKMEPASLKQDINIQKMNREELVAISRDLVAAEGNARSSANTYKSVLAEERSKIEQIASSIVGKADFKDTFIRSTLAGVDRRHSAYGSLLQRQFEEHSTFYHNMGELTGFLAAQYGRYVVQNNMFRFQNQSTADQYNVIFAKFNASSVRIGKVQEEYAELQRTLHSKFSNAFGN